MRSFTVLFSVLATAACSPNLGVLVDIASGGLGSGAGDVGAIPGEAVGAAIVGGIVAGAPGAVIGGILGGGLQGCEQPAGDKDIFHYLGIFTKGIPDTAGRDKLLFEDVVSLRLPGVLQDGYVSLVVVGRADGGIVNTIIPGLGTLLGNVVIAIGKIFDCVLGPQGKDVPYLCQKDYLSKYGYIDIGSCSSAEDIIEFYNVKKAKMEGYQIIHDFTNGQGKDFLPNPERIIFERFILITDLLEKDYRKWNSEDFKEYAVNIIIITCTLIEKQQKGLGDLALDQYLDILSKHNENKQFPDLSSYRKEISDIINTVHKPNGKLVLRALTVFSKDLTDVVSKENALFKDFVTLKLPGLNEDGFNNLIVVGRVAGGIINNAIPGLGQLLDNLVTAAGKIFVCIIGSGKDTAYICRKDYLSKYGYEDIGSCSSASDIIKFYKVKDAKKQAQKYINDYTEGKGVDALSVNEKIVYEHTLHIANLFDSDCNKWSSKELKEYVFNVAVVACVIFESQQRALGRYALNEYIVALSKYNKNKQFPDLSGSALLIYDIIEKVEVSTWNGAFETTYKGVFTETTDGIFPALQIFAKGLPDSLGKVKTLFEDVANIKLLGGLYDAFSLVVTGRGLGALVNILIPGLGDLFSNIVIAIGKIFVCILGPDAKHHFLCQKDYLTKYGYNDIATCSSASEIIEFYNVTNAQQQALKYINDYTNGKGVDALTVTEKLIYERVNIVASLIDKDYNRWHGGDLKQFLFSITAMTCIIIENQYKGQGFARGALDAYIPSLMQYNSNMEFSDLADTTQAIYDIIDKVSATKPCKNDDPVVSVYKKIVSQSDSKRASSDSSNTSSRSGRTVTNADGSQLSESNSQNAAASSSNQASSSNASKVITSSNA